MQIPWSAQSSVVGRGQRRPRLILSQVPSFFGDGFAGAGTAGVRIGDSGRVALDQDRLCIRLGSSVQASLRKGREMSEIVVWAVDIGSVMMNRFGWCRRDGQAQKSGHDIHDLVLGVVADLAQGKRVALGFECPLFVPITDDPKFLTRARVGEGARAWCAGAGSGALATGLSETVWVLERIRRIVTKPVIPTLDWMTFRGGHANLFLWEAFVTGAAKGETHLNDAEIAALMFWQNLDDVPRANAVKAEAPYSLIGAALLRAGLTTDLAVLFEPCVVIKA